MPQHRAAIETPEDVVELLAPLPGYVFVLIRMGVILVLALAVIWLTRRVIRRFVRRIGGDSIDVTKAVEEKRAQTIAEVLRAASTFVIWTLTLLLILGQIPGINIGPILAAVGIGGVALGFGAQNLVKDVISGFFILVEDQYHVGDVIQIGGVSGLVERITLRATVLRDLEGHRHVVPNGEVTVSTNMTKGFSRYMIDLPVPYDEDVDRAVELVRETAEVMRREPDYSGTILGPLEVLGVDDYADSQVTVKIYVETLPGKQWAVGRELRRRIKHAYDEAGISIPFPHREVIIKQIPSPEPEVTDRKKR